MELFSHPAVIALACCAIVLSAVSCVLPRILSIILDIVNIGLHIAIITLCFCLFVPLDELTLVIMALVFVRSLAYMIFKGSGRHGGGEGR